MDHVVCKLNWLQTLGDAEKLTFLWVEFHKPLPLPVLKGIKVSLELRSIIVDVNDTIDHTVVSKQSGGMLQKSCSLASH